MNKPDPIAACGGPAVGGRSTREGDSARFPAWILSLLSQRIQGQSCDLSSPVSASSFAENIVTSYIMFGQVSYKRNHLKMVALVIIYELYKR